MDWSLDELYVSFESDEFKNDMEWCFKSIGEIREWADKNFRDRSNPKLKLEQYITMQNDFFMVFSRLIEYAMLTQSTDARNEKAQQAIDKLENAATELTLPQASFQKWLGTIEELDRLITESNILQVHQFYLEEAQAKFRYILSEGEEVIISKMQNTGSNSWSRLQELLTSTLLVDINMDGEDKRLPLSAVRNLAYETDGDLRKTAYHAELKAYEKIVDSSAACLNGIKGEVITICELRGYESSLQKTLLDSRLERKTLDAMLEAIKEFLPVFHKYFRKKAELMGHENGLPFYDLFAPMGESSKKYSYLEAREFIVKNFAHFSERLAQYADNAFEKRWIDVEPKEGKRGGAFCANLISIQESRILTNFSGSFSDVITLAHELGHGYHGHCLAGQTYINSSYPMPIAETASVFCETIIKNAALKEADNNELLSMLESDISDAAQIVVDIYCRYLFESEVFERRKTSSLTVRELNDIMINAQKEAYGDGLDHNYLHPYMWVCKPHYYFADSNFYNFPYTFGLLFAKGLYAEYIRKGQDFIDEYDSLLSVTGKMKIEDIAGLAGIDIRSPNYWRESLKLIKADIEKFLKIK